MDEHDTLTGPQPPAGPAGDTPAASPRRTWRVAGYVVGAVLVLAVAVLGYWFAAVKDGRGATTSTNQAVAAAPGAEPSPAPGAEPSPAQAPGSWQRPVVSDAGLVERSGVRITQVAITGGGGLLDLRFQVIDPDKAAAVHDAATPPAIVEAQTGLVVNSLLMGHSHTDPFHAGQTYYLVFENPGNLVQRGNKVSVLLGNAEVDDVLVK